MKAMILAAGLGNRMRPLTDHTPKPLLSAGGKPLLQYHLESLTSAGITEVIINLAYLGEQIRDFVGDGSRFGLNVCFSQEPEPLETGGALLQALPKLGNESFLLVNGDVWCDLDFSQWANRQLTDSQLGHLLLVPNPAFHPQGDFALTANGQLLNDLDKACAERYTYGGIGLLNPALIRDYPLLRPKFPLVEVLRRAIDNNQLSGDVYRGHWSDVGTPQRLQELEEYLAKLQ
jgi:N-acetyl-alpha-D-muramate 1-phosphate uridylyltransferase